MTFKSYSVLSKHLINIYWIKCYKHANTYTKDSPLIFHMDPIACKELKKTSRNQPDSCSLLYTEVTEEA